MVRDSAALVLDRGGPTLAHAGYPEPRRRRNVAARRSVGERRAFAVVRQRAIFRRWRPFRWLAGLR